MPIFSVLLFAFCFCLTEVHNAECVLIVINKIVNESDSKISVLRSGICCEEIDVEEEILYEYEIELLPGKDSEKIEILNENGELIGVFFIVIKQHFNSMFIEFSWFFYCTGNVPLFYNIQGYFYDDTDIFYCDLILSGEDCIKTYISIFKDGAL